MRIVERAGWLVCGVWWVVYEIVSIDRASRQSGSGITFTMNVIRGVQEYVARMLEDIAGMKVLLMDKDTVRAISE